MFCPSLKPGRKSFSKIFCSVIMIFQILMDSLKRKAYDDELRREEILSLFRRSHNASHKVLFMHFLPAVLVLSELHIGILPLLTHCG